MEKNLTNSGPFMESTSKHSIYSFPSQSTRYVLVASDTPTTIPEPGLPFSLVLRAEPGKEDVLLQMASAYEAASQRRVLLAFGPLPVRSRGAAS